MSCLLSQRARESEVAPSSPHLLYHTNSLMHAHTCTTLSRVSPCPCRQTTIGACSSSFVCPHVGCCYRLFHAQDVVATHDCGSSMLFHRRGMHTLLRGSATFLSSVTRPSLACVPSALPKLPASSAFASQPGSNPPFPSSPPRPLHY